MAHAGVHTGKPRHEPRPIDWLGQLIVARCGLRRFLLQMLRQLEVAQSDVWMRVHRASNERAKPARQHRILRVQRRQCVVAVAFPRGDELVHAASPKTSANRCRE